jgi:hypothetical protein
MTRQHFQMIADVLRDTPMTDKCRDELNRKLGQGFRSFNENYDHAKFVKAATPTK